MGRAIFAEATSKDEIRIVAALERESSPALGQDAGVLAGGPPSGVVVASALQGVLEADVLVDFSSPEGTLRAVSIATEREFAILVGTTGLDASALEALRRAASKVPVLVAPNTSIGVTVLFHLAEIATRLLGPGYDAEIVEMHHARKLDAPSGTALRLADAVLAGKGLDRSSLVFGREGRIGPRKATEVGVLGLRGGDVIGEHTLVLAGDGERLELTHRATDRALFAKGALRAARWLARREPGSYDMFDVLGMR